MKNELSEGFPPTSKFIYCLGFHNDTVTIIQLSPEIFTNLANLPPLCDLVDTSYRNEIRHQIEQKPGAVLVTLLLL